jgi:hypothetical protein
MARMGGGYVRRENAIGDGVIVATVSKIYVECDRSFSARAELSW